MALYRARGLDRSEQRLLCQLECRLRLGHFVYDLLEGLHGLLHLVVLRGDEGIECIGIGALESRRHICVGRVCQTACLAHLLEDDRVHAAAEVCVVELLGRIHRYVELLAAVRVLQIVYLLGVVLCHDDLVLGREQLLELCRGGIGLLTQKSVLCYRLLDLLRGGGAVVGYAVCVARQVVYALQKLVRRDAVQTVVAQRHGLDCILTIGDICAQGREVRSLAQLGIGASLEHILLEGCENRIVTLHVGYVILDQRDGLLLVLGYARDVEHHHVGRYAHTHVAGHGIEFVLYLLGRLAVSAQIIPILLQGHREGGIVVGAEVVDIDEREELVGVVLLVEHLRAVNVEYVEILLVVDIYGSYGLYLRRLYRGEEVAHAVAVGGDRGDLRLLDLLLGSILALKLVEYDVVVVAEHLVCPVDYVLLGDLLQTIELGHVIGPVGAVDEAAHVGLRTPAV